MDDGVHDELAGYERQFRRAGLPLFIEDWSARTDAFNRAFPLLALVFVLELLGALNLDWPLGLNLGAVAGAVAFAGAAVALANRRRGRPALAVPEDLGPAELAGFVVVPAALPLIFNGQLQSAAVTAAFNLAVLGVVALGFGFGIGAILVWALRRLAGQLAQSVALLARALPLLLLFAVVLFINTEMWQVFGQMEDVSLIATGWLLFLVVLAFLAVRIPREVRALEAGVAQETGHEVEPLRRPQRANVGLVMLISHGLQVLVVTVAITAFFVALGMLVIGPETTESWIGTRGEVVAWSPPDVGVPVRITHELLRVSAAIGALSGLYYAISVLTDSAYREEFLDELTDQMTRTFEARSAYLALVAQRRDAAAPAEG
ncbi:MAG: hypothetical protein F2817_19100 [Actinobacteria bacterium]|nr:hypothetical protein [Actinomycetota bacterium]